MEPTTPPESLHPSPATPVMDVVPPKPPETLKKPPQETEESVELKKPTTPPVTKSPKHRGSGVGLAIFATIVIVLGLAVLVVYAYLRTNHIQVF